MNTPSVKTLLKAFPHLDRKTAAAVKLAMIEDQPAPREWFSGGTMPARQMHAINALIGGHGVEYIGAEGDRVFMSYGIEYVNTGDTYNATVIYDYKTGRFSVTTVGDVIERNPRRFGA